MGQGLGRSLFLHCRKVLLRGEWWGSSKRIGRFNAIVGRSLAAGFSLIFASSIYSNTLPVILKSVRMVCRSNLLKEVRFQLDLVAAQVQRLSHILTRISTFLILLHRHHLHPTCQSSKFGLSSWNDEDVGSCAQVRQGRGLCHKLNKLIGPPVATINLSAGPAAYSMQ